jgi:hypothetical protein
LFFVLWSVLICWFVEWKWETCNFTWTIWHLSLHHCIDAWHYRFVCFWNRSQGQYFLLTFWTDTSHSLFLLIILVFVFVFVFVFSHQYNHNHKIHTSHFDNFHILTLSHSLYCFLLLVEIVSNTPTNTNVENTKEFDFCCSWDDDNNNLIKSFHRLKPQMIMLNMFKQFRKHLISLSIEL